MNKTKHRLRAAEWLRGASEVRLTCAQTWMFLNRCASSGIALTEVRCEDDYAIRFRAELRDLSRVRELAERCGGTPEVLSSRGWPLWGRRIRRHTVFCAGLALCSAALWLSSLFIWHIEVTDNDSDVPDAVIVRTLAAHGVGIGTFSPPLSGEDIRAAVLPELPGLSFLSVNVRGSRASVTARASVAVPKIWDAKQRTDITASHMGVITEMRVLEGEALAAVGDAVAKGRILVSGERPGGRSVHARAEVTAHTWREYIAEAPLIYAEKTPVGRPKHRFALIFGEHRLNFYRDSGILPTNCDKITDLWELSWKNVFTLPVTLVRETWLPYALQSAEEDEYSLTAALENELALWLFSELDAESEVLTLRYSSAVTDGCVLVTLRSECAERIDEESVPAN